MLNLNEFEQITNGDLSFSLNMSNVLDLTSTAPQRNIDIDKINHKFVKSEDEWLIDSLNMEAAPNKSAP